MENESDKSQCLTAVEQKREKARKRVEAYRKKLTPEQKAEINRKRRERRAAQKNPYIFPKELSMFPRLKRLNRLTYDLHIWHEDRSHG